MGEETNKPQPKYRVGQVVCLNHKNLPFWILDVTEDEGEYFYAWSKKNYAHEPMIRALKPEEV
ncbi:MAG TPA: hypothetical protein VGM43_16555 [Bryobacteraceae bacterium]|jgi:hypothetical protein